MKIFYQKTSRNGHHKRVYFCGIKIFSYKNKKAATEPELVILRAGICNRLKGFFSFLRLQHTPNKEILMYWKKDGTSVNKNFYELFDFDFPLIREVSTKPTDCYSFHVSWRLLLKPGELPASFKQTYPRDPKHPDIPTIDLEYNRIPKNIQSLYLPYFELLKPSSAVRQRMNDIKMPEKYVAVHIRLSKEWATWNRGGYEQIPLFVKAMKKYPQDTLFFLASFDKYVSDTIKKAFPNRILELPNKDLESSIDAVAELYLLSGGTDLIATYGSSFSEVAWWLSRCSQKVTVVGTRDAWKNGGMPDKSKSIKLFGIKIWRYKKPAK